MDNPSRDVRDKRHIVNFSVQAALDHHVAEIEEDRPADGRWHPSSLSSECSRKAIYTFRGVEESDPADSRARRVFRVGHILHEFAQTAVAKAPGVKKAYHELRIDDPELNIAGHTDDLVEFEDGSYELQEYKSKNSRSMEVALSKGELPDRAHVVQAGVYMFVLRRRGAVAKDRETGLDTIIPPLGDKLSQARITYLSKDDMRVEEFVVPWDDDAERLIREQLDYLEEYRQAEWSLPPRLPMQGKKKHWMCEWKTGRCPFFSRCWELDPDHVDPHESDW